MLPTSVSFQVQGHISSNEGMGKISRASGNKKKVEVAILIFDQVGFKQKIVTREKEGHYIMI